MPQLWFLYALGASVIWGFTYAISEKLLRDGMTPAYLLFLTAVISVPFYLFLNVYLGTLKVGFQSMLVNSSMLFWTIVMAFSVVLGNYMIVMSVFEKNATVAALVEISYPVFTILFAWLLMRELQINCYSAVGGLLIFAGIAIILLKG